MPGIRRAPSGAHVRPVARPVRRPQEVVSALAGGRRTPAPQAEQAPPAAAAEPKPLRWWQAALKPKRKRRPEPEPEPEPKLPTILVD